MATLDELVVRIKADASQLDRELRRVQSTTQQSMSRMGGAVGGLTSQLRTLAPALTAVAFTQFARRAVEAAGHIQDMAERIGFAASTLSALEAPLAASGSSLDDFAASIGILNNQLGEAGKGNQEAVKAFDQLGLSVRKLQELSPEERFYAVTRALGELEDQSKLTESGRNLLGRGFASMIPLLKQYGGDIEAAVDKTKELNDALSDDTIKRIDEFGDALSQAGINIRNSFLEALAAILKVSDAIYDTWGQGSLGTGGPGNPGGVMGAKIGLTPQQAGAAGMDAWVQKAQAGGFVTSATFLGGEQFGPPAARKDARGSNAGLLKPDEQTKKLEAAKKAYDDYIQSIEDENYLLHINEREREGMRALLEAQGLAQKANIKISEEEREKIIGLSNANREMSESMQEAERFSRELHDKLSSGLADIVLSFDDATDAAKRFAEQIAKTIIERKITGPLADGIIDGIDGGGFFGDLFGGGGDFLSAKTGMGGGGDFLSSIGNFFGGFFADGGRPPMGKVSVVGENGPELFVPDTAGTVIPNGASIGGGVTVVNNWNIQSGVSKQELAALIPTIEQRATAGTLAAIEKGGRAAQVVGKRS